MDIDDAAPEPRPAGPPALFGLCYDYRREIGRDRRRTPGTGRAVSLVRLRAVLAALLPELRRRHRVRTIAVFDSLARGETGPGSDIGLLVTSEPQASLFDLVEVEEALTARFWQRVEMKTLSSLHPEIVGWVWREAMAVQFRPREPSHSNGSEIRRFFMSYL